MIKVYPPLPAPEFKQDVSHPLVNITRSQAILFADWLTRKEQKAGLIGHSDYYRLPTDEEWTLLAADFTEEGKSPNERHTSDLTPELNKLDAPDLFPWGNSWPPSQKSGNFSDKSKGQAQPSPVVVNDTTEIDFITQYNDQFPYTAPVGQFNSNKHNLYDVSGNVWEWVDDSFGGSMDFKFKDYEVARGGAWSTYKPFQLLTRYRLFLPPHTKSNDIGFRLVLVRQTDILSGTEIEQAFEEESSEENPEPISPEPEELKKSTSPQQAEN